MDEIVLELCLSTPRSQSRQVSRLQRRDAARKAGESTKGWLLYGNHGGFTFHNCYRDSEALRWLTALSTKKSDDNTASALVAVVSARVLERDGDVYNFRSRWRHLRVRLRWRWRQRRGRRCHARAARSERWGFQCGRWQASFYHLRSARQWNLAKVTTRRRTLGVKEARRMVGRELAQRRTVGLEKKGSTRYDWRGTLFLIQCITFLIFWLSHTSYTGRKMLGWPIAPCWPRVSPCRKKMHHHDVLCTGPWQRFDHLRNHAWVL